MLYDSLKWQLKIDSMMKKRYIFLLIMIALVSSCTEKADVQGQYGTVCFSLGADIVLQPASKAAVADDVLADFILSVPGTVISGRYSEIAGQKYFLAPGDYEAAAYYPAETAEDTKCLNDGYGDLHYYGTQAFSVSAGNDVHNVSVGCLPDNARVSVVYTEKFRSVFDMGQTYASVAEDSGFTVRVLQMEEGRTAYFSAGDKISVKINTCMADMPDRQMEFFFADRIAAQERCSYTVTVDVASDSDGITFTIDGKDIVTGAGITIENYTQGTVIEDK